VAPSRDGKAAALFPTEPLSPCSFLYTANDDPRAGLETRGASCTNYIAALLFETALAVVITAKVSRLSAGH